MAKAKKESKLMHAFSTAWGTILVFSQSAAAIYLGLISTYADWKIVVAAILAANVVYEIVDLQSKRGK